MASDTAKVDGIDTRDVAAYPVAEAARLLRLPTATLRTWTLGRSYSTAAGSKSFHPLIRLPGGGQSLSFNNLVEAHVLMAIRTKHAVACKDVRTALTYAEGQLKIDRLLLRTDLLASSGELFLERYGKLINLSRSGQLAMRILLEQHLERIESVRNRPTRFFPFVGRCVSGRRSIVIDPNIQFGRPVLASTSVSARIVAERIDSGETVDGVAADYGIERAEVEDALLYAQAA